MSIATSEPPDGQRGADAVGLTRHTALALALLVGVAAALRIYGLDRQSLWIDEAYAVWYSRQSLDVLWRELLPHAGHPPLFWTLVKGWRWLFGDSEVALRSVSLLASVATVPVVYLLGKWAAGPERGAPTGLLAALLFALAPLHIDYAQQAYLYSWLTLAVAVSLAGALWLLAHPEPARRPWLGVPALVAGAGPARANPVWAWLAVAVGCALSLWLHNTAATYVAGLGLCALWIAWRQGEPGWLYANLALAAGLALALWSPFAMLFLDQVGVIAHDFWIGEVDLAAAFQFVPFLFEVRFAWPIKASLVLVPLAAYGLFALSRQGQGPAVRLMVGVVGLAYGFLLLFSVAVESVLVDRLLIWVSLPFYVAVSAGLLALGTRWVKALLAVAIVGISLYGYASYHSWFEREPWRDIAGLLARRAAVGDVVLNLPNSNVIALDYYLDRSGDRLMLVGLPVPYPSFDYARSRPAGIVFVPGFARSDIERLDRATGGAPAVWYVERVSDVFDPERIVLRHLRQSRRETDHWRVRPHIDVYRFE